METLNSIGFVNFWGVTPAMNILISEDISNKTDINMLISNTNDIRHILKTVSKSLESINSTDTNQSNSQINFNFYFLESNKENLARFILILNVLHDRKISIRDRVEIVMDIYGNTLNSSRTAEYISYTYKELIRLVTGDKKYTGILNQLIDFNLLSYKDKDDLIEILAAYDLKCQFDIEKYREDRLRYMYKDRYDYRENLSDWDYQMNLREFAPVIKHKHYLEFRESGVSFIMRTNKYNMPNRTLSSYIPGRDVIYTNLF
jgi:dynein assembly factor 3